MSTPHVNLSFVLSVCQKLSKLVDIWRTGDKNNFVQFFWDTVYVVRSYGGASVQTQRTQRIYAIYEFPKLRKLQPIGIEMSSIQLNSSF